eukprot:gene15411-biopygen4913
MLECDKIKSSEMKEKIKKEYLRRVKLILKSKLNAENVIMAVNGRAVSLIRYGADIVDWIKAELEEMDRKTGKIFTMNGSLHPRSDVDRLYLKRTEGGRGLQCLEEVVKLEELSLAFYLSKKEEKLLNEVVKEGLFRETEDPKERKRQNTAERKKQFEEKVLHGQFERGTKEIRDQKGTWLWLKNGYLKKETEGLIVAAQDQALRTNWIRRNIDKENISAKCRLCGRLQKELEKLDYRNGLEIIQKACLLGSARIIRKVLDTPGKD